MELRGRTALLTGATGGLGRAIAEALAARGATLILSSRKAEELSELASSLPGDGHRTEPADLAEPGAALDLVARTGDLDVLVANAGLPGSGLLEDLAPEDVLRALRVNLEAPMLMCQAIVPGLRARGHGHLVLVGSLNSKYAPPRSAVYAATKFGLRGFGLALREDLRADGIGVSVVMPGFVREAGMFADSGAGHQGLGTTTPDAVAQAVVRGIERNRGELHVAPFRQVAGARIASGQPELVGRLMNARATRAAEEVTAGQRGWR